MDRVAAAPTTATVCEDCQGDQPLGRNPPLFPPSWTGSLVVCLSSPPCLCRSVYRHTRGHACQHPAHHGCQRPAASSFWFINGHQTALCVCATPEVLRGVARGSTPPQVQHSIAIPKTQPFINPRCYYIAIVCLQTSSVRIAFTPHTRSNHRQRHRPDLPPGHLLSHQFKTKHNCQPLLGMMV